MRVGYVVLYVTDAEACKDFWTEKVGMIEKGRKQAGEFSIIEVGFADQSFSFELVPKALMAQNPDGLDLATPSIAFRVEDLFATHAKLVAAGVQAMEPREHGGIPSFPFSDNEGRWFAVTKGQLGVITSIFVNLPVENLKKSVGFFTELGFTFNAQFTDDESTCMIVNETIYVMLLEHKKFESFISKPIAPKTSTEAILAFSLESADEVRAMTEKALSLGARKLNEPQDHGFMFSWGFEDLDGHLWDLFWMNPEHVQ